MKRGNKQGERFKGGRGKGAGAEGREAKKEG